jgi:hypothetical protein
MYTRLHLPQILKSTGFGGGWVGASRSCYTAETLSLQKICYTFNIIHAL